MKYYTKQNSNTKHGYELVAIDHNGHETTFELNKKTTDNYLYLPEQCVKDTNRRLISMKMISTSDMYEITPKEYHEPRTLSTNTTSLMDYLNDEDRAIFTQLIEKAKKAREEATKKEALTPVEKAQRAVERAMAKLKALQEQE